MGAHVPRQASVFCKNAVVNSILIASTKSLPAVFSTIAGIKGTIIGRHSVMVRAEQLKIVNMIILMIAIFVIHLDNAPAIRRCFIKSAYFTSISAGVN